MRGATSRFIRALSLLCVAVLAAPALAQDEKPSKDAVDYGKPSKENVAELVSGFLTDDSVDRRSQAILVLFEMVGSSPSFRAAKQRVSWTITAVQEEADARGLKLDRKLLSERKTALRRLKAKEWEGHVLDLSHAEAGGRDQIIFLDGFKPKRFMGAAVLNELVAIQGDFVARFVQANETKKLLARGLEVPEGMVLVPEGDYIVGSLSEERRFFERAVSKFVYRDKNPKWTWWWATSSDELGGLTAKRWGDLLEQTRRRVRVGPFLMARSAVSNRDMKPFFDQSEAFRPCFESDCYLGREENVVRREHPKGRRIITEHWRWANAWIDATGEWKPGHAERPYFHIKSRLAEAFAKWKGARMPTKFEWEAACRGYDGRIWAGGNSIGGPGLPNWAVLGMPTELPTAETVKSREIENNMDLRYRSSAEVHPYTRKPLHDGGKRGGRTSDVAPEPGSAFWLGQSPFGLLHMTGNLEELIRADGLFSATSGLPPEVCASEEFRYATMGSSSGGWSVFGAEIRASIVFIHSPSFDRRLPGQTGLRLAKTVELPSGK